MYLTAVLITVLASLSIVSADSGFATSCTEIEVLYHSVTAQCLKLDGAVEKNVTSTLDLNKCYANVGGRLYVSSLPTLTAPQNLPANMKTVSTRVRF